LTALVRGDLDWIVMKALEKDRARRYETANGFALDVQRYLAGEAVLAAPASRWYRLRKFVRRNRGPVAAAGLVTLVLLGGIAGTTFGLLRAERAAEAERLAKQDALADRDAKASALAAETKAREAEKRAREHAMKALRTLTDEVVENQMARGTALPEENKEFLRKIIKQYEGFAAVTGDDAESKRIRAEGYICVAKLRSRLGDLDGAEIAYRDALTISQQVLAVFPSDHHARTCLGTCYNDLGLLLSRTKRPKEAESAYRESLAIRKQLAADFPTRENFRQDLGIVHNNLGILLHTTARPAEAESVFRDGLAVREQLVAQFPTSSPDYRWELAVSHSCLGRLHRDNGKKDAAETAYRDALAIYRQLTSEFPTRPLYQRHMGGCYHDLGLLLRDAERPTDADIAYRDALSIQRRLVADFPNRPEYRTDLANCLINQGVLFLEANRLKEAEAVYRESLPIAKQLAADFPRSSEFQTSVADNLNNLGYILQVTSRQAEADAAFREALAIRRQLAADFPDQPNLQDKLGGTLTNLAEFCNQRRDFREAKSLLAEAVPHLQSALNAGPRNPTYRHNYSYHLTTLTLATAGLGEHSAAVQTAATIRDLGWDPPGDAYDAACALARCIPIVQNDERAKAEDRDRQEKAYGDEAMKLLRAAAAGGYRGVADMTADPDLVPLRNRGDYAELIWTLADGGPAP
jgi:tetratricopeptide (TPR) repeat protein